MALIDRSVLLLMLLACSGCVTDQFGASTAATPGQPAITITRSDDFTYRAAAASVEINGKPVATLSAGRTYTGTVPPGPAVLKVSAWSAPIGLANHRLPSGSTSYRFTVESGKSYSFVISPRGEPAAIDITHDGSSSNSSSGEAVEGTGGAFQIAAAQ
ncbi:MAG: hypothetical protein ACLPX7_23010 [Xanthobacteraceae bacterium]